MAVARLGALAFDATDIPAWRTILVDILGMEERPRADDTEPARFRYDELEHRISLHPSDTDGVHGITWEVDTAAELEDLGRRVTEHGITVEWHEHGANGGRSWVRSFTFIDPEGFPTEIRFGATWDHTPYRPSGTVGGYLTGDFGMGHIVLICKDYTGTVKFYEDVLDFKISDYIVWADADATFFHVNGRHHSLALMNECFGQKGGQFNHFMVEVNDIDDTGRAYDAVKAAGIPLTMDFGRHTNDGMTSFYLRTPSGFALEVGSGGILVNDAEWEVKTWRAPARWGHQLVKG